MKMLGKILKVNSKIYLRIQHTVKHAASHAPPQMHLLVQGRRCDQLGDFELP